jgi:phenylalanyl-tRNA synthetase alpha chain
MENLDSLRTRLMAEIEEAANPEHLEEIRVAALGRKGRITALLKGIGGLDPQQRKEAGGRLNALKKEIAEALARRRTGLREAALDARLASEQADITLPIRPRAQGCIHPITQTLDEVATIFGAMGFTVAIGPDIEDDFHNFTALNIPPEHPARQMHDTFYFPEDEQGARKLLRTHTSPVQIRAMMASRPPLRIIAPGRTYRCDSDQTHTPMFHQVEGLAIDESIHFGHLKGCLVDFCRAFFEVDDVPLRFRPSFFPFTEPSAEVDIGCSRKGGELRIGTGGDWLEVLGCGMVHPNVLSNCRIDPDRYQGFAFGLGIERLAMLKYGIPDLRTFFDADLRWLRHYGFAPLDVPGIFSGAAR